MGVGPMTGKLKTSPLDYLTVKCVIYDGRIRAGSKVTLKIGGRVYDVGRTIPRVPAQVANFEKVQNDIDHGGDLTNAKVELLLDGRKIFEAVTPATFPNHN